MEPHRAFQEPDRREREAARLRLDANVVVEAGAGTGKTTLLTDRLLFLLLAGAGREPPRIDQVVALTFTEKAASEIKLRLAERLLEILSLLTGGEGGSRAAAFLQEIRSVFKVGTEALLGRARAALEDMDRAAIGTIHSFASRILRAYPVQAGVDPSFTVDEGALFDELFAQEWARWLDEELGERAPRQGEWLEVLRLAPLGDLEDLARELCREGLELEGLGRGDQELAAWLKEMASGLSRAAAGQPPARGNSKILETLEALSRRLSGLAGAAASEDPPLPPRLGAREIPRSRWPADWDPAGRELYERTLAVASRSSASEEALLRRAFRLLLPFARSFREGYTRRGLVSFDGLLRKARDLVRDHREVRDELKRRAAALLIDEFQDTDPLQGELLIFLAEETGGSAGDWRRVRLSPRLFVVGDPKQSIYRFRGADMAAYQMFSEHILKDPRAVACRLRANFRSPACLLGPVNAIFQALMRYEPGLQPPYSPVEAAEPSSGAPSALELVCVTPPKDPRRAFDARSVQAQEAAWIARWILENCGEGGYRHKDVAVLLRSSAALREMLEAFKASGIPYAVEMEGYFYGAQEVIDLWNLLRALEDPDDRLALAGLLRSPLAALEDRELLLLARSGRLSYLQDPPRELPRGPRERLQGLFACLRRLRDLVGRIPLGELVSRALDETQLLALAGRAYHGEQTVSNLLKFGGMASQASEERGTTLREFIDRVEREMREGGREGESPLADEFLDAVRVLTIHKAKGLEFPVVFLSNASGGRGGTKRVSLADWGAGKTGLRLPSLGAASAAMAWLETQEALRQEREAVRLLYVALTRAKERLFVLGREKGDKGSFSSLLASAGAWPREGEDGLSCPGSIRVHRIAADAKILGSPKGVRGRPGPLVSAEKFAALWEERLGRQKECAAKTWTLTPTAALKEPPKGLSPAEEGELSQSPAALVGQACHKVLESWDFRGGGDLGRALASACKALSRLSASEDWEAVSRESREILEGFLASRTARELSRVEILGREIPFVHAEEGSVMRGSIDLLYRRGGRLIVADYKSDRVSSKDLQRHREKYRLQGAAYCRAVEKALGVQGVGFRLIFLRAPELALESHEL